MICSAIDGLIAYAVGERLLPEEETVYARNLLLDVMREPDYTPGEPLARPLPELLNTLTDLAVARGIIPDSRENRDLFDTRLMNCLTPRPAQVRQAFRQAYGRSPAEATDYFYRLSQSSNYIRRDRIAKDRRWVYNGAFGPLDITINKSKPEKDPRDIAAAGKARPSGYPRCLLCAENEGYAGRIGHPARASHRIIPLTLGGEDWALQYSPYVYYNEHCIVLSMEHRPMAVSREGFVRLLDFVGQFPHYFVGSNADLPIVGGSILSHDHFQGGRYTFAMETAQTEAEFDLPGFSDVRCGRVHWPISVLRLQCADPVRLADAADAVLRHWRTYSDPAAGILARTDAPHNTITPIARRRDGLFELDLALRNNRTTAEHPLGLFHPHAERHHIKKENIGLIEVMGLAVLPARLDAELDAIARAIAGGTDLRADPQTEKHASWAEGFRGECAGLSIPELRAKLELEVGRVFEQVLCDCGVFPYTEEGGAAFTRYLGDLESSLQRSRRQGCRALRTDTPGGTTG